LRLTFTDGLVRELDFSEPAADWGGVLEPLRDLAFSARSRWTRWPGRSPGPTASTSIQMSYTARNMPA